MKIKKGNYILRNGMRVAVLEVGPGNSWGYFLDKLGLITAKEMRLSWDSNGHCLTTGNLGNPGYDLVREYVEIDEKTESIPEIPIPKTLNALTWMEVNDGTL